MTGNQRWTLETRASTLRALGREDIPLSATALHQNLDCDRYDKLTRSERAIGSALRWLTERGLAEEVQHRDPEDPPGKLYAITDKGRLSLDAEEAIQILEEEGLHYAVTTYCNPEHFSFDAVQEVWSELRDLMDHADEDVRARLYRMVGVPLNGRPAMRL